jgi:hypothetical protein
MPLPQVAAGRPLLAFAATTPAGAMQQVVGLARSDVDRVDVVLANGDERQVALNAWHAFTYRADEAADEAVRAIAYAGATPIGEIRLPQTAAASPASPARSVVGVAQATRTTIQLAHLSPLTLQRTGKGALTLPGQNAGLMALSPDGNRLALATSGPSRLVVLDLRTLTVVRDRFVAPLSIRALAWPVADRLIELRQTMGGAYDQDVKRRTVEVVDPLDGRVLSKHALTNKLGVRGSSSSARGLVLLLGSSGLHGPTMQLVFAAPTGVRTVSIPVGATKGVTNTNVLTVDAEADHAYIVVAGGTVFDVDLATMGVTRHVVARPAGTPDVTAPRSILLAHAFGGNLAVAGAFSTPTRGTIGAQGVFLVDTASWSARVLDPKASTFATFGNRLLTYGVVAANANGNPLFQFRGHGLSLYDDTGSLVSHLYGERTFETVWTTPGYGHVLYGAPRRVTLNPKTGRLNIGPTKQLVFGLESGRSIANRPLATPGSLIYRGSGAVGEG